MCTVSFVNQKNGFVLTSNRDERVNRKTLVPDFYFLDSKTTNAFDTPIKKVQSKLLFPKDEEALGSWIACDEKGKTACLLNGAFGNHKRKLPYKKSRGLVVLESFKSSTFEEFTLDANLNNIEPFTMVLVDAPEKKLWELKWDGEKKHIKALSFYQNYIWSSPTLYRSTVHEKKELWFKDWMQNKSEKPNEVLSFHSRRHGEVINEDVVSIFNENLKTISITQIILENEQASMRYHVLENNIFVDKGIKIFN